MTNIIRPRITKVLAAEVSKEFRAGSFNMSLALLLKSHTFNRDVASKLRKDLSAAEKVNRDSIDTVTALTKDREFKQMEYNNKIEMIAKLQREVSALRLEVSSQSRLNTELKDTVKTVRNEATNLDMQLNMSQKNVKLYRECASENSKQHKNSLDSLSICKTQLYCALLAAAGFGAALVLGGL